jgi:hypothetical protein
LFIAALAQTFYLFKRKINKMKTNDIVLPGPAEQQNNNSSGGSGAAKEQSGAAPEEQSNGSDRDEEYSFYGESEF